MLATLAAPHPDPGHAVDRTAAFLWYTLCVIPQSQARVCQRAKELGIETYAPMSRTPPHVRKFGRQHVVAAEVCPLMPGYVFVSLPSYRPRFDLFQHREFELGSAPCDPMPPDVDAGYVANKARPTPEPIRGCLRFISCADGPMAVSEAVIEDMRLRERNGEFDLTAKTDSGRGFVARWVKRGATVEFIGGPFKHYFGVIEEVLSATLVKVGMTMFGSVTPIDAPLDWIRRTGAT